MLSVLDIHICSATNQLVATNCNSIAASNERLLVALYNLQPLPGDAVAGRRCPLPSDADCR